MGNGSRDLTAFVQVDIVYIKTEQPKREKYIRRSLELGKYVISDAPMTDNKEKLRTCLHLQQPVMYSLWRK